MISTATKRTLSLFDLNVVQLVAFNMPPPVTTGGVVGTVSWDVFQELPCASSQPSLKVLQLQTISSLSARSVDFEVWQKLASPLCICIYHCTNNIYVAI